MIIKMEEQIIELSHIERFKHLNKCIDTIHDDCQYDIKFSKLLSNKREIYYSDALDRLKNNDIVLRKVNDQWQITVKIDSDYGYHHIKCQTSSEADFILSSLIRQRLHQMTPHFEIVSKSYLVKTNKNELQRFIVCNLISPTDSPKTIVFKESKEKSTSKYRSFLNLIEKPKLIKKPSIKLLARYGSKELIQYESKLIERQQKFKSLIQS